MNLQKSFRAYVTACRGNLLLGGVKHHESSRFATSQQASDWIITILEGNSEAGRAVAAWGTETLDLAPEVAEESLTGYDGSGYEVGDRVELHPTTDLWMRGARYGEVIGTSLTSGDRVKVRLDKLPKRTFSGSADTFRKV